MALRSDTDAAPPGVTPDPAKSLGAGAVGDADVTPQVKEALSAPEPTAGQQARETNSLALLNNVREGADALPGELSSAGSEASNLYAGRALPGTDPSGNTEEAANDLIAAIRGEANNVGAFRNAVVQAIKSRGSRLGYAGESALNLLANAGGSNHAAGLANALTLIGSYEGQRRNERMAALQGRMAQYNKAYTDWQNVLHQAMTSSGPGGTPVIDAPTAKLLEDKVNAAWAPLKRFGPYALNTMSQNMAGTIIAEKMMEVMNDRESRSMMFQRMMPLVQKSLGDMRQTKQSAQFFRGQFLQHADEVSGVLNGLDAIPNQTLQADGFASKDAYRLWLASKSMLGDSPAAEQIRQIIKSPDPNKAIQDALTNGGGLSPQQIYGAGVAMMEGLTDLVRQGDVARAEGVQGAGITREQFERYYRLITMLLTNPQISGHVNNAAMLSGVLGSVLQAPSDFAQGVSDSTSGVPNNAKLSKLEMLLEAIQGAMPHAQRMFDAVPDGGNVLALNSMGKHKAFLARQFAHVNNMLGDWNA